MNLDGYSERFPFRGAGFRRRRTISKAELTSVLQFSQPKAAKLLGISVSTLKKRYKEVFPNRGRWGMGKKYEDNDGFSEEEDDEIEEKQEKGGDVVISVPMTRSRRRKEVDERLKLSYILNDEDYN